MSLYRPERLTPELKLAKARQKSQAYRDARTDDEEFQEKRRKQFEAWRESNREHVRRYARDRARFHAIDVRLRRKGLDPAQYRHHVINHSGFCDVCGGPGDGRWKTLNIDHCHATGAFRGMLCGRCNLTIGALGDDTSLLLKVARYLENFQEKALTMLTTDIPAGTDCQEYRQSVPDRSAPLVPAEATQQFEVEPALTQFRLTAFDIGEDGAEDVEIITNVPAHPDIRRHASLALLFGLAVMSLDQDGTIERRIDELMEHGFISEVDAVNQINLLTLKDANDQRI